MGSTFSNVCTVFAIRNGCCSGFCFDAWLRPFLIGDPKYEFFLNFQKNIIQSIDDWRSVYFCIEGASNCAHRFNLWPNCQNGDPHCFHEITDAEKSSRRCLNFNVLPKAFEKPSPRLKVFQQRTSERRPNFMESTWGRILTNPRYKDPSYRRGGKVGTHFGLVCSVRWNMHRKIMKQYGANGFNVLRMLNVPSASSKVDSGV